MKTFTVIQGDDEEFALLILDPITGDPVDLSVDIGWSLTVTFKGKKISLVKSYTNAELVVNQDHPDPSVEDLSIQILLTSAESSLLPAGLYSITASVLDSEGLKTTIIKGEPALLIQKTP